MSHFLWITILHLPSHLAKSRHGVFYFRLTFRTGGVTTERRIATRKRNKLAAKTLYEYGNYHRLFVEWLEARKKKKHIPVHSIT